MKRSWVQLYQNTKDQRVLFKATWKHTLEGKKTIQVSSYYYVQIIVAADEYHK